MARSTGVNSVQFIGLLDLIGNNEDKNALKALYRKHFERFLRDH